MRFKDKHEKMDGWIALRLKKGNSQNTLVQKGSKNLNRFFTIIIHVYANKNSYDHVVGYVEKTKENVAYIRLVHEKSYISIFTYF